jgi:uncharacterized membrane protein
MYTPSDVLLAFVVLAILSAPVLLVLVIVALVKLSALKKKMNSLKQRQDNLEALCGYSVSQQPIPQQPAPEPLPILQPGIPQPTLFPPPVPQQSVAQRPDTPQAAPQQQPGTPQPFPPPAPQPPAPQQLAQQPPAAPQPSLETFFGRNVIGIVASVLVFLGLVFLGFLVVPLLTDALKITALFLLSALLGAVGFILNRTYNNNFTKALLGTGCGAFFISIMLTHLWFHAFSDLVALVLLLVWLILCFILTKATQSLLVVIVTHLGMAISVTAACIVGVDDGKMMLVLAYQVAATVVILVGNILCYRKTYRFGLYASLVVSHLSSLIVWGDLFSRGSAFSGAMPSIPDVTYFLIQFIGSTALVYLLLISSARIKQRETQATLQVFTMLLWLGALTLNVGVLIVWMMETGAALPFELTSGLASVVLFALASIFVLLAILLRRILGFSRMIERITICMVAGYLCLVCCWRLLGCLISNPYPEVFLGLLYLVLPAAMLILMQRLTDDELYGYLAAIPLGIDALFMVGMGYERLEELAPIGPSLGYLALMGALLWLAYRGISTERRSRHGAAFRFIMLLYFEVSLCAVAFRVDHDLGFALALLLCAVALGVFHYMNMDSPLWAYRINEYGVAMLAVAITFRSVDDLLLFVVHIALVLTCLVLMFERVRQVTIRSAADLREGRPASEHDVETFTALVLFLLIVGTVNSLADWSQLPYVLSLACMAAALLVIALGFWSRTRSLRLTGLVVLVICVLKLTVLDIGDVNSIMRVVAFIIGGIICFAISALYNFLVKLQEKNG